jgi:hypothetical protein
MTRTPIKKVNIGKEKLAVLHVCTQSESIKYLVENNTKLSIIITGDGNPEAGLCRQVALINERQHNVLESIKGLTVSVDDFHKKYDETREAAQTAQHAIDQYKEEVKLLEESREKTKAEKRAELLKFIEVISIIIAAIGLIITSWFSFHGSQEVMANSKKIDDLGTPVIVNSRGLTTLPQGDTLKFFRDGKFKNTMRDSQVKDTTKHKKGRGR